MRHCANRLGDDFCFAEYVCCGEGDLLRLSTLEADPEDLFGLVGLSAAEDEVVEFGLFQLKLGMLCLLERHF